MYPLSIVCGLCVCVKSIVSVLYQGLFRIAAGASKLKKLKAALDCSTSQLEEFYSDPHAVAGTVLTPTHVLYMFQQEFSSNRTEMTVRPFLT